MRPDYRIKRGDVMQAPLTEKPRTGRMGTITHF
jgi:hypothetical protein